MIETTVNLDEIANPFSFTPNEIVGYRRDGRPIYNIAGGAIDVSTDDLVDDDDSDDDAEELDDSDDDDEPKDKWVPPSKEEFDKILAAKAKADSEAAARKRFLREAGLDPKTGKPVTKPKIEFNLGVDEEDEVEEEKPRTGPKSDTNNSQFDPKKIKRELDRQLEREVALAEQRERARSAALLVAVPEALDEAGFNPKNLKRALKLLDLDSVTVDSDGEIEGLQEQIDELKADFPEFFKRTRMREAAKEVADTKTVGGGKKTAPPSEENLDFATRLKNQLYGGSR
jgi:hypothetical protein